MSLQLRLVSTQGGHLFYIIFALFINRVSKVPLYCKLLCFANDMKLFYKVDTQADCIHLQENVDKFVKWSSIIELFLNIGKCKSMFFSRCRFPYVFPYSINDTVLVSNDNEIRNLGLVFTSSLSQEAHIDYVTCKAIKLLDFIKIVATEFKLVSSLKALLYALVRPLIEYGSCNLEPRLSCLQSSD